MCMLQGRQCGLHSVAGQRWGQRLRQGVDQLPQADLHITQGNLS